MIWLRKCLRRLIAFFSSLKLTVVCLGCALVLTFTGTLAQVNIGLYLAQEKFFRSLIVWWSPWNGPFSLPVFPGGYLIGVVLAINLITAYSVRFSSWRKKIGLLLIHSGLLILLVTQCISEFLQVESAMRLREGETRNYSESLRFSELVLIDQTNPKFDRVAAIDDRWFSRSGSIHNSRLPLDVRIVRFYKNCRILLPPPNDETYEPAATQGHGRTLRLVQMPLTHKMTERNIPGAVVEIHSGATRLGTWLVSPYIDELQTVADQGHQYGLALRFTRYYKPFAVELRQFRHDTYRGTDIPKNFSSLVVIKNPAQNEEREALIRMNNPMRYGGETFYQGGYDEHDPKVTILQVVRNPGWLGPYISSSLVASGLVLQFLSSLLRKGLRKDKSLP